MKKQYLIIAFLPSYAASIVHSMPGYVLAQEERQEKIKIGVSVTIQTFQLQTNENMALVQDGLGHKNIAKTERYCNIPIKRLQDDFPTYVKVAKNGDVATLYVATEPSKMESLIEK